MHIYTYTMFCPAATNSSRKLTVDQNNNPVSVTQFVNYK